MKRFGLVILCAAAILVVGFAIYFGSFGSIHNHHVQAAEDGGPLSNATVSFGGWMTNPPLDRFPNNNPITANHHRLTPETVKIKAGGTVNFIIGGFHHVLVYDDGTKPSDINPNLTVQPTNGGPPLINDPNRRIYRGLDPSLQTQDRVEVVHFDEPGTYLVICGVRPHFLEGMYGYVKVVPGNTKTD
jgi:plastocyanin